MYMGDECLMNEKDFYEGKFAKTARKSFAKKIACWTYALKKERMIEKYIGNGVILDIGCGGGNEILADKGECIGIDISKSSLQNASKVPEFLAL